MNNLSKFQILRNIASDRKTRYFIIGFISFVLCFFVFLLPGSARDTPKFHILDNQSQQLSSPGESSATTLPKIDIDNPQEFANFVNDFFQQQLSETKIPGAAIAVVKDGEIFFSNGYGYANLEQKIPVDADKTLFRVASLSKLFTATSAMQLYERGALDLNENIDRYLPDWQLENPYSESVTPARMMMHTDGTTQRLIGLGARTKAQMQPLAEYLPKYMPAINYPPGKFYSYSNHSIALLGYLVEQISGMPFVNYVDKNIFQPLEMRQSSFEQPPVAELPDNFATGYQIQKGKAKAVPYLYLNIAPAAALMTTATDMAHFMLAHLQQGSYRERQILNPETVEMMHQTHYQIHPKLPGTGYSFRERLINNKRAIGHLGSLRGYSSSLTLIPEENIGIFIACNSFSNVHGEFITRFFDRYFPGSNTNNSDKTEVPPEQLERYTGTYRDMEYPRFTIGKITGVAKEIKVTTQDNGTLLVKTPPLLFRSQVENVELTPTSEPGLFYRDRDNAYVFFVADDSGNVTHVSNPLYPKIGTYQRMPWYETITVQLGILIFCAIFFLTAIVAGIIRPLLRILSKRTVHTPKLTWVRTLAGAIALLNLVFLIGLPLYLWLWGPWKLAYGVPPVAVGLLGLPILSAVLTLILFVSILVVWRKNYWSWQERSHYSLVTIAAISFIPLLAYWNLLCWQF
ncbi:serine hydrolase [Myxosarcina sp. GI1]|uniref:serine hydrolase n=1 Tax=Myxosarcina sp. GI1 TaxID=1541065 RepID=UPI0009DF8CFB|nr:serine hydrolase [Myxosarcina sp. GI1]